jgi:hypothetical protein
MSNKIDLKPISELLGMNFFIPDYQRGYRWSRQQVKDLLEDIQEFIKKDKSGFYCIQPLVVREREQETFKLIKNEAKDLDEIRNLLKGSWEVIDGQQRLTTIHVLHTYLISLNPYTIEYETRGDSKSFLSNIVERKKEDNIDYYHIIEAKNQIDDWFKNKNDDDKLKFIEALLNDVKFIWYESADEDPIKVFTRLNIGKIPLTNAELIKALFLNKSNFKESDYKKIRLQQQEIASEWDTIENTLQNDEFWLFLNELENDKPTRIDFIFDLICEKNSLNLSKEEMKDIGSDEYKTFRYFYCWFKKQRNIAECWQEVKLYYQTFQEWFNDLELYHYTGFLIEYKIGISDIITEWNKPNITKETFLSEYVKPKIKQKLFQCSDLEKQYEVNGNPKTQCRPLLLLHNIQTIISQNKTLINTERYRLPVFYKFPFHLFKKEKWDVEHIDSHTENPLENEKEQQEWLKASFIGISDEDLGIDIKTYLYEKCDEKSNFEGLYKKIVSATSVNRLTDYEKDRLWNFTLLDASTNRSYGNAIFPAKRRAIIGKDQGKTIKVKDDFGVEENDGAIAFIPPCTKNIFLKYYNPATNNMREWAKDDAKAYLDNIQATLKGFLPQIEGQENE